MLKKTLTAIMIIAPFTALAITMNAGDSMASEKIRYMQSMSGTNNSRLAAYVLVDQAFTQWCGHVATVNDLKRIAAQNAFSELYAHLSSGQMLGMTKAKNILVNNNPKFCKG